MADISTELGIIQSAEYGEQVRTAIHDAIFKINKESGGGGEEDAMSMYAGLIHQSLYGRGTILDTSSGELNIKKTSDYADVVPYPVYDAVQYTYNNVEWIQSVTSSIDDIHFIYVRQGRARPNDSRDNWYDIFLSTTKSFRIASNGNSLFPLYNFYDVMYPGIFYYVTAGINGFNPQQDAINRIETKNSENYYYLPQVFSSCYSYIDSQPQNILPFPCYAAFDPGDVVCYDAEIKVCSA